MPKKKSDENKKYLEYPNKVLSGEIVAGEYIHLACKRYLSLLKDKRYYMDEEAAEKAINFIEHLKHTKDRWAGKPFILEPWQKWILYAIFGLKVKATKRRLHKKIYISIARKNGKSFFASGIALYVLCTSKGAEIEYAATNAKQAGICYEMTKQMAQGIDKKHKYFKLYRDKIKLDKTFSFLQVISSDSTHNDGWNSLLAVVDEFAAHKDSSIYDILASSQGARSEPLMLTITSRGFDQYSFCKEMEDSYIQILRGNAEDNTVFAAIYSLDANDEWDNPEVWIKSNPNLNVTVTQEYIEERIRTAKQIASEENDVRVKTLNQWTSSNQVWIPERYISQATQVINLDEWKGRMINLYLGLDLSSVCDLTALSLMWEWEEKYYFKVFYFLPSETLENGVNKERYKKWAKTGELLISAGNVLDYEHIKKQIQMISQDFFIYNIFYDRWNSSSLITDLTKEGYQCTPYAQNIGALSLPTKELSRLIYSGRAVIDNNEITRWCFSNVTIYEDANGNQRPVKDKNEQKIDGVLAMLSSLGGKLGENAFGTEIYTI